MMETTARYPSYATCVVRALSASQQPLSIDALLTTIGRQRPVGKGARQAVYRAIREIYQAVPVAPSRIGWLSHLLQGSTFRHPLATEEARRGFLLLDELEHAVFFPQFFQTQRPDTRVLTIDLMGGPTIQAEAAIERKTWSVRLGAPFAEWIEYQGGQGRDDVMITVRDAVKGEYLLRLQPREGRDEETIRDRNIQVALAAEDIVTSLRRADKVVPSWELAALLIGRGAFYDPVPPDDLHMVLHKYSMLRLQDGVGYILDTRTPALAANRRRSAPAADATNAADAGDWDDDLSSMDMDDLEDPLAWLDDEDVPTEGVSDEDSCPDYESYLEGYRMSDNDEPPLSHSDYHLLEAELETLLGLEQEFGYLLPEQGKRVDELAIRLFIDPESLRGDDGVNPSGFADDDDDTPFWQN